MKFLVILPNRSIKIFQCPSDIGIWQFLTRFYLKPAKVLPADDTTTFADLTLDEDGFDISSKELDLIESW